MSSPRALMLALALVFTAGLAAGCGKQPAQAPKAGDDVSTAGGTAVAPPGTGSEPSAADPASAAKRGSPTEAYNRLRAAVGTRDWGAFYDAMGPTMRAADAADPAHADLDPSLSPREKVIAGMENAMADLGAQALEGIGPESFLAIWEGTEVKSETIDGDRATLTITKDGKDWQELFVKEDGQWKFDGAQ